MVKSRYGLKQNDKLLVNYLLVTLFLLESLFPYSQLKFKFRVLPPCQLTVLRFLEEYWPSWYHPLSKRCSSELLVHLGNCEETIDRPFPRSTHATSPVSAANRLSDPLEQLCHGAR
jgi:hypothetical protein